MWELLWVIVGIVLDRLSGRAETSFQSWRNGRYWDKVNRALRTAERLTGRLEIVQTGWAAGAFEEEHIHIQLDGSYEVPQDVRTSILEPSRGEWATQGFKDNLQCGVRDLQIVRTTDSALRNGPAHEIRIKSHTYLYFEAKATHFEWFGGRHPDLLQKYAAGATHDSHSKAMPTGLSVGLSLFCEGGKTLVLTKRTAMAGAGGHLAPGQYFNAVGENCAPVDVFGELDGTPRLSIFRTAARGLLEEMGLDLRQVTPILHTFCWDRGILDYKFFGYVVCQLSMEEVRMYWNHAPDKSENRELIAYDVQNAESVTRLVHSMCDRRQEWSDEACMCTLMGLLHRKRLSVPDLIASAG